MPIHGKEVLAMSSNSTLAKMGIHPEQVEALRREMAEDAIADVCTQTNPRKADLMDLEGLIKRVTGV